MQHILILGAGYGGLLAALRLQPQIKNGQARVTLVNASDTFTERIRNHQVASGQTLKPISIPNLLNGTGVEFVQDTVRHISPSDNIVTLDHQVIAYDVLGIALGSQVNRDAVQGVTDYAYTLDTRSTQALQTQLKQGGRLLIIGGGLTGIEAATEFAERDHVDVQLITRDVVGAGLSPAGRDHILQSLAKMGVTVQEHVAVKEIHANHADSSAGQLDFDACLWAGGFKASPLVKMSGFLCNGQGQMLVRDTLQAIDYDNVYGIGDVASVVMQNGNPLRMACAVAMPMGAHAADNMAHHISGHIPQAFRFSYAIQCISLGRRDALVQKVAPDDTPQDKIYTGRIGALVKEMICKYTVYSLKLEKRLPGAYWYPKALSARQKTKPITQQ